MRSQRVLAVAMAVAVVASAGAAVLVRGSNADAAVACPHAVLRIESEFAPIADVLRQAQSLLAKRTVKAQGSIVRLTPQSAPMDIVESLRSGSQGARNDSLPGASAIYEAAKALCGARTAEASWAIHWDLPMLPAVTPGEYSLIVKTKHGWQFWGAWDCAGSWGKAWKKYWC